MPVDPPGSVFTFVCDHKCLNPDGTVAGAYADSSGVMHGFVRQAKGTITSFDAPAPASLTTIVTLAGGINLNGEITGYSLDSNFVFHGFVRRPDGSFTTFDDPEAGTGPTSLGSFQGTAAFKINLGEAITGQYFDASNNGHGFERFRDGQFANFDAPDADPGSTFGTRPSTNNAEAEVAGWYMDAGGLNHGFLWIPGTSDSYAVGPRTPGQSGGGFVREATQSSTSHFRAPSSRADARADSKTRVDRWLRSPCPLKLKFAPVSALAGNPARNSSRVPRPVRGICRSTLPKVRCGSCVTSAARIVCGAQLYER
jgi:hypothetical protein